MIPYGKQSISEEDIQSVVDVLRSDFITQGPAVVNFEKSISDYTGAKYAVAVCNATAALHLSCLALGVGKGDIAWTSPNTFVASANCALYCGADVDFVDIDEKTYNMSVVKLEEKLIEADKNGRLPKVVIPVHFAGQSCDMKKIHELSQKYGFKIIEDASHAIGGRYDNQPVGSCRYSDITVFSFHPVKIITTGEGGMAVTNDAALYEKISRLRSHGITRDEKLMIGDSQGPWYYQQIELGYNFRITDIQAALGASQMKRLDEFVLRRNQISAMYGIGFQKKPLLNVPVVSDFAYSAYHLYVLRIKFQEKELSRRDFVERLKQKGILTQVHYIPVYQQAYYMERYRFSPEMFPATEQYYKEAVSIPMYPSMTDDEVQYVTENIIDSVK